MSPLAVPVFAFAVWLAGYLIGRDVRRALLWRAALALLAFAAGLASWAVAPGSLVASLLLCVPVLAWAGAVVALLPHNLPERRQIERGWLVVALVFLGLVAVLPGAGRLVVLAPLIGALALLWRSQAAVQPAQLPVAMTAVSVLYAVGLAALLVPVDLGAPTLVLAAMGLDLLVLGFLVAVADATDSGERLRPDLRRSAVAAAAAALLVGGPATLTMLAAPELRAVEILQYALVAVVMAGVGLAGAVRRGLDRVAFVHDERLRLDRAALQMVAEALPRRRERHSLIALSPPEFVRLTERALRDYGDPARLLRSPLIDLPTVDRRLSGLNADRPLARAVELRAVLAESVARLRPPGSFATTEEWRHYNALHYCCVLGLRPYQRVPQTEGLDRDTRRALEWFRQYVPKRSLRKWQAEGAELVAGRLWRELVRTDPRWLSRPTTATATRS